MAVSAERALWCAVLTAGLHDAARGADAEWINSRDFRRVCDLAGMDPEAVATRFDPERFRRAVKAA